MDTKTLAIRLVTGFAGSAALLGALVTPALAYYPSGGYNGGYTNNSSAYCSDRYSPSCIEQAWGPGYFQTYNTNYNSWYQTSSPYYAPSYSYVAPTPTYSYVAPTYNYNYVAPTSYSYPSNYSTYNNYDDYDYSAPSYSYQYQYQYQYSY